MKISIVIVFLSLFVNLTYSQNHELDAGFQFGMPVNELIISKIGPFKRYSIYEMEAINDKGFSVFYKYRFWKKLDMYVTFGVSFSEALNQVPLNQFNTYEIIDNVMVSNKRLTYKILGLEKKFKFYNDKLNVNLGWSLTNELYVDKYQNYNRENLKVENSAIQNYEKITYKYNIDVYYNDLKNSVDVGAKQRFMNGEYYLQFQGWLTDNISLNFTLNYYRNIVFFYNYSYRFEYDFGDYSSSNTVTQLSGTYDPHYASRNHYLGMKLGFSYKL